MLEYPQNQNIVNSITRLRTDANLTQALLAEKSGLDQSHISRIEKGDVAIGSDIDCIIDALIELGASTAVNFKLFINQEWNHIKAPSFWNPELESLKSAEKTLVEIDGFLQDSKHEHLWLLRRQIEHQRDSLERASAFLNGLDHNIAFIGNIGVGKSTAISFVFDLLMPPSSERKTIDRPVLEQGAGGTTICEVHIKSGSEFGISLVPMSYLEMRELVLDFCAVKWRTQNKEQNEAGETINVSREVERAIRNMSGLGRKREKVGKKIISHDPVVDIIKSSGSENEFRASILELMNLEERTRHKLQYDGSARKHPMEWVKETFKAVNNGRLSDVPMPKSIDLLVPNFGRWFGEFEITVIDTKGVDDIAVRKDIDYRLKDPRTTVIFCSSFNDAPGTTVELLLEHMSQTFSERFDTGKVAILGLPRSNEARSMTDDSGDQAQTDEDGYELKQMQVNSVLAAKDLTEVPVIFYNVVAGDPETIRSEIFDQLNQMRKVEENKLLEICGVSQDIISNPEAQALNLAIEKVAKMIGDYLDGKQALEQRKQLPHENALNTISEVRYASTLWASTRRKGDYLGLDVVYHVGVGIAQEAKLRSENWFNGLNQYLDFLKNDENLFPAGRLIEQIRASVDTSKQAFFEAVQQRGVEAIYREPMSKSPAWRDCEDEWGKGPGFKMRVEGHLKQWFDKNPEFEELLEQMMINLWERKIIAPLMRLIKENAPEV